MTTVHTRQPQQYTQDNLHQYTQDILKYNMLKGKQHQGNIGIEGSLIMKLVS
jgi:hypothetical protein